MQQEYIAYYCTLTEYEAGWGSRPDGVVVATSIEYLKERIKVIEQSSGDEFTRADHEPKLMILSPEGIEKLQKTPHGMLWCSMRDFTTMRKDS